MIRRLKQDDVPCLSNLLKRIDSFTEQEHDVAMELIEIAANNPLQSDYHVFVYENDNQKVVGYHCTGQRPLTDGVYDLYWIASDPESGIKGVGQSLIKHAEDFVSSNKGRWLLAETSSKESYLGTQKFYMRNGFSIIAEIKDFYSVGDDLLVFGKYFVNK